MAFWQPASAPGAHSETRANEAIETLKRLAKEGNAPLAAMLEDGHISALLKGAAGNSPFLARLMTKHADFLVEIFAKGPDAARDELLAALEHAGDKADEQQSRQSLMADLRTARARMALLVALADLGDGWRLKEVTAALSAFADLAVTKAVDFLLGELVARGEISPYLADRGRTDREHKGPVAASCGFFVLALGKLGGRELNYSSDIDLITLFDPERVSYHGRRSLSETCVRLVQDLVHLLNDHTPDGYVFRVDLRLRPDPGSMPLAINTEAALAYYQTVGQNWERAALIKARFVAGDQIAAAEFLHRLEPFVWRKSLDFASIEDIHTMRNRVHSHFGPSSARCPGHNVKLGPGGIREIEFIAQVEQMVSGGRERRLRVAATRDALDEALKLGRLTPEAHQGLDSAYDFFRMVEHRLQMVNDEQTQIMPARMSDLVHIATFAGYDDPSDFIAVYEAHVSTVRKQYADLLGAFGVARDAAPVGEALATYLSELGFADGKSGAAIIGHWRRGRHRALRTDRSRRLLEAWLLDLLEAFSATSDPSKALARFDSFLSKLPAGVQLFSLFEANHWLFHLIAKIMGSAPSLADHLARRPETLDIVLDPGFLSGPPDPGGMKQELTELLVRAPDYEAVLNAARRWTNDMRFAIGVHLLEGLYSTTSAGQALTLTADVVIASLGPHVMAEFHSRHGTIKKGEMAVVAMGSYGGGDLSFTSDLDLILLYEAGDKPSTGPKKLAPSQYYSRLGTHFLTALQALTEEGRLYEVDLRLRPSGRKGPLVVTLETFEEYQKSSAWTWEHMALTRARVVVASRSFGAKIEKVIAGILRMKRNPARLILSIDDMRRKIESEFGSHNIWDIRNVAGGLVDIEFICQALLLKNGHEHPEIFTPDMKQAIENLVRIKALDETAGAALAEIHLLYLAVQGILRLCHESSADEKHFSAELMALLAAAGGADNFDDLKIALQSGQNFVSSLMNKVIKGPAAAAESANADAGEDRAKVKSNKKGK